MKRVGNLWPALATFENLQRAYLRARRGKRFRPEVLAFESERERNLLDLLRELDAGIYVPGAYRTFSISDPKP